MELYPAEVQSIQSLLREWVTHSEYELEATFGTGGVVDATAFLHIAQRLKAKGYTALPQEDTLNIITPEHVRYTLKSMRAIQAYCRDDTLEGKPFTVMIKDRTASVNTVDLSEYNSRIKVRRENPLGKTDAMVAEQQRTWDAQKKAFRLIRRWTFDGNGMRVDMSIVRSTPKDGRGDFKWQRRFSEKDVTKEAPQYEIEVEMKRDGLSENVEEALAGSQKVLIRGMGEILRGLQKHSILVRKTTRQRVLDDYKKLVGTDRFRGVAPVTLMFENMKKVADKGVPNIRSGYNVTDKADGLRVHAFTNDAGELFMIDMSMDVYRTGLVQAACKNCLLDGEWVTKDKDGRPVQDLLLFDAYIFQGKDVTRQPFAGPTWEQGGDVKEGGRYGALMDWVDLWNEGDGPRTVIAGLTAATKLAVSAKQYRFAAKGDSGIFKEASAVLDTARAYNTDGLIFTPNASPLPSKPGVGFFEQLKWKPAHDNTVDFLVLIEKEGSADKVAVGVKESTGERIRYKKLLLYVGSDKDPVYENPRGTILYEQALPDAGASAAAAAAQGKRPDPRRGRGERGEYKPVLFNPREFPDTMANTCYRTIEMDPDSGEEFVRCENGGDPIQDRSIVEMAYEPDNEAGWRWVPIRVRYDKTERLQRGILGRTLNKDEAAENVWNSIHEPVTVSMIRSGAEQPASKEVASSIASAGEVGKVYYARKAPVHDIKKIEGLRNFHNSYIKEKILLGTGLRGGGKTLLDMACGQGGDIQKWRRENVGFVLGVDVAGEGIRDAQNGAYRRYLNSWISAGRENVPPMVFVIGSSARSLTTGDAGATPEESNMLRSVLGRYAPDGLVPPYVEKHAAGILRPGADCVALMFALHYFFENEDSLRGILHNIRDTLKVGGLFIGCCFDGQRVFDALRNIPKDGSLSGMEGGAELWKLTKRYDALDLTHDDASIGLPIDVEFVSIGTQQREYLVPFELLKKKMAEIGCELLNAEELKEVGLKHSTALFEESWEMARAAKQNFPMTPAVKQVSFFNRWFIFKKRRGGDAGAGVEEAELDSVVRSLAVEDAARKTMAVEGPVASSVAGSVTGVKGVEVGGPGAAVVASAAPGTRKPITLSSLQAPPASSSAAAAVAAAAPIQEEDEVAEAASAAQAEERTMPTEAPAVGKRAFAISELYLFFMDAAKADRLKLNDPTAAQWLDPSAPFPITHGESGTVYPSLEHYLAGMKYQYASNKPELGANIFSRDGTIHSKYLRLRGAETAQGTRQLPEVRDHDLLKQERTDVLNESKPQAFKKYRTIFDEALWSSKKDAVLEEGLKQRWEKDVRLRRIVEAVRDKGLYLLYYTGNVSGSDLGGVRRPPEGFIDGENKVGKGLMRLAGFRGV